MNMTNGVSPAEMSAFFVKQSYNQFSVDFTILPEIDMGVATSYYASNYPGSASTKWTDWGKTGSLADDVRAKARGVGLTNGMAALYDSANYDLYIIALGYNTYFSGAASDGSRSVLAANFNALPHEICHCLGLQHANGYSRTSFYSPVRYSPANPSYFYNAYGNVFCLMGYKPGTFTAVQQPHRDANAYFKYELGWLTTNNILTATTSGTYRIHAFDQGALQAGSNYALRIVRDSSFTYWFDFRQAITNLPDSKWSQSGLEVLFGGESGRAMSGTTMLLDMTPGSRGPTGTTHATMHDAPLQLGRTYSDAGINLHVTPIRKGGTTPESLDVVVNFGPFPTNGPTASISPASVTLAAGVSQTFTVTAADPNGDTLSYYWEFDDNTQSGGRDFGGLNADATLATQGRHAWSQNGTNIVRCTVSDMKGHVRIASAWVTVTNGSVAPFTVYGVVKDELGNPLQGAIVSNIRALGAATGYDSASFAGSSETAADGKYRIPVPAGGSWYTFSVSYQGYTNFSCSAAGGSVYVAADVPNVNFTQVRLTRTISGGIYTTAGSGYDSAVDGLMIVSNGVGQSVVVSNGGWQLDVPDGTLVTLTATATNPNYIVSHDFPSPYLVVDDILTLHFFVEIPGAGPHTGFTSSGTNGGDTVGTVYIPLVMTPPAGMTNWYQSQSFFYWIDDSSTAEYGVDYSASGGLIIFNANADPVPYFVPLTVIRNMRPKSKTVVIRIKPSGSISAMGALTTYTYTILTPGVQLTDMKVSPGLISFAITNLYAGATNYIERTHDLLLPEWTRVCTFSVMSDATNWSEAFDAHWTNVFYRIKSM